MKRLSAGLMALFVAGLLAGCGGGGGGGGASSAAPAVTVIPVIPSGTIPPSTAALSATGFAYPQGLAVSADGKTLYVADASNNSVIEIALDQPNFPETSLPLVAVGGGTYALSSPTGLAVDSTTDTLYIANFQSSTIAQVDLLSGVTTTMSLSLTNPVDNPTDVWLSADGSSLFIASHGNGSVVQASTSTGSEVANYSPGTSVFSPWAIYLAPSGSTLYVSDNVRNTIGTLQIGTGSLSYAPFASGLDEPMGMVRIGAHLYVANYQGRSIAQVDPTTGTVLQSIDVSPRQPFFLATDGANLYFTDGNDGSVNEIEAP